jgi:hypothetical protein
MFPVRYEQISLIWMLGGAVLFLRVNLHLARTNTFQCITSSISTDLMNLVVSEDLVLANEIIHTNF